MAPGFVQECHAICDRIAQEDGLTQRARAAIAEAMVGQEGWRRKVES